MIEIVDVGGVGIVTSDSGVPRRVDPDRNAQLFLSYLTARSSYTNGRGQMITQRISEVPVASLELGALKITPPMDLKSVPQDLIEDGFLFPAEPMLDAADIRFKVTDRRGRVSEEASLWVAVAPDLFRGPWEQFEKLRGRKKKPTEDETNPARPKENRERR